MNRRLTQQEIDWLILGLKTLDSDECQNYVEQIKDLRVVYKCSCGEPNCHTVHFQYFERAKSVSLVNSSTVDGRWLIIFKNEDSERLAELEII